MSKIRIYGDTSGYVDLTAPAISDNSSISIGDLATSSDLSYKLDFSGGKIIQVVRATDSTSRSTTSTSFVDVTGMSVTITPTATDSKILIIASLQAQTYWTSADNGEGFFQITNSSNTAISGFESTGVGVFNLTGLNTRETSSQVIGIAFDSPSTTDAITYKLRFKAQPNVTVNIRNDQSTGQMFAMEISA